MITECTDAFRRYILLVTKHKIMTRPWTCSGDWPGHWGGSVISAVISREVQGSMETLCLGKSGEVSGIISLGRRIYKYELTIAVFSHQDHQHTNNDTETY